MTIDPKRIKELATAYTVAWNSGSAAAVAEFFSDDGTIAINRGEPWMGRTAVAQMAAGFFADIPDLKLVCDEVRMAGDHVAYLWTFTGTHAVTNKPLRVVGWEEWELDAHYKIRASKGWYDADDYSRQSGNL